MSKEITRTAIAGEAITKGRAVLIDGSNTARMITSGSQGAYIAKYSAAADQPVCVVVTGKTRGRCAQNNGNIYRGAEVSFNEAGRLVRASGSYGPIGMALEDGINPIGSDYALIDIELYSQVMSSPNDYEYFVIDEGYAGYALDIGFGNNYGLDGYSVETTYAGKTDFIYWAAFVYEDFMTLVEGNTYPLNPGENKDSPIIRATKYDDDTFATYTEFRIIAGDLVLNALPATFPGVFSVTLLNATFQEYDQTNTTPTGNHMYISDLTMAMTITDMT